MKKVKANQNLKEHIFKKYNSEFASRLEMLQLLKIKKFQIVKWSRDIQQTFQQGKNIKHRKIKNLWKYAQSD